MLHTLITAQCTNIRLLTQNHVRPVTVAAHGGDHCTHGDMENAV